MTPTPIQLRLQHQAGQRLNEVWATVLPTVALGPLTLTLPLLGNSHTAPQINWNNFGWTLANRTTDARIYINQQPLEPGHICHITIGDILDIGLCRFVIEPAQETPTTAPSSVTTARTSTAAQPLTELSIDTFMESLTQPPHIVDSDAFESLPIAPAPVPDPTAHKEIIAQLNDAYLQALQDPDAGLKIQSTDPVRISRGMPQMPTDDGSLTLEEIISSTLDIDTIAERFSDLGSSHVLERERSADVLWLFAPEGQTPPETHRLPPRSRQDHHLMSLNSSYRIAAKQQVDTAQNTAP